MDKTEKQALLKQRNAEVTRVKTYVSIWFLDFSATFTETPPIYFVK